MATWTHVFREYLRENKKVRETVVACSYGAQVESFKQKDGQKSRDTVPLRSVMRHFAHFFFMIQIHLDPSSYAKSIFYHGFDFMRILYCTHM